MVEPTTTQAEPGSDTAAQPQQSSTWRRSLVILAIAMLPIVAVAAYNFRTAAQDSGPSRAASAPPPALAPVPLGNPVPEPERLSGVVVTRSGPGTGTDVPLTSGSVLVVPTQARGQFWQALGYAPEGPDLTVTDLTLPAGSLPPAVEVIALGADGAFASELTGTLLLCYSDSGAGVDEVHIVGGCGDRDAAWANVRLVYQGRSYVEEVP